jgi:hypothetical protein
MKITRQFVDRFGMAFVEVFQPLMQQFLAGKAPLQDSKPDKPERGRFVKLVADGSKQLFVEERTDAAGLLPERCVQSDGRPDSKVCISVRRVRLNRRHLRKPRIGISGPRY